jgi:hypothetical protein
MAPVLVVFSILLLTPGAFAGPHALVVPRSHAVVRQQFPGTIGVYELASVGQHVLVVNSFANGSQDLVMFDPAHNSTKVVEAANPPGTYLTGVVAAGGKFVVGWENLSNAHTSYQIISTSGTVSNCPKVTAVPWTFPYGNATALFASSGSYLVQVDPATLAVVHNYSAKIPAGVTVNAVLPVGPRLYISGTEPTSNGTYSPFFGYLNRTNHRFHSITSASTSFPADLVGNFFSILDLSGTIYVGGADTYHSLTSYAFNPVAGLFFAWDPSTGGWTNLSAVLPHANWGVYAMEPWSGRVGLSLNDFAVSSSGASALLGGGFFTYKSGASSLANLTNLWGAGYLANVFDVTSETGGYLTSGGEVSSSGISEVVSVKT